MSAGRTLLVALAAAAGFAVGFYSGALLLLTIVGLDEFEGWQFVVATLPLGGLTAGVGAAVAAPETGRIWGRVLGGSLLAALVIVGGVGLVEGDFGIAFVGGGLVVVATAITLASLANRR